MGQFIFSVGIGIGIGIDYNPLCRHRKDNCGLNKQEGKATPIPIPTRNEYNPQLKFIYVAMENTLGFGSEKAGFLSDK